METADYVEHSVSIFQMLGPVMVIVLAFAILTVNQMKAILTIPRMLLSTVFF